MTETPEGNQALQENTTVFGKKKTAGIEDSPEGKIQLDGCPAGAGCAGRYMHITPIDRSSKTLALSIRGSMP